jgi:release factor glutamine methyltransferase
MRGSGKESSAQQTSVAAIHLVARHPDVYEPCDDSFALVDALLADKSSLLEQCPNVCMEIGCGSGYVITSLALILGDERNNAHFIATDISTAAAQVTQDTLEAHGVQADIIVTDLVRGLEDQLSGAVDVLLFNPPYVPTPEHEVIQCLPSL